MAKTKTNDEWDWARRVQHMEKLEQQISGTEAGSEWLRRVKKIGFGFPWDDEDEEESYEPRGS